MALFLFILEPYSYKEVNSSYLLGDKRHRRAFCNIVIMVPDVQNVMVVMIICLIWKQSRETESGVNSLKTILSRNATL